MLEPIQRASVFLLFSLRPETLLTSSSKLSAEASAALEPSKISVVSSAYWLILISLLSTETSFMFTLFLTALANTSAERINRCGNKGQPCLTPRRVWYELVDHPLFRTQLSVSQQRTFTQLMIDGPNPNKRKELTINDHSSQSKAFSKSIKSSKPGVFSFAAYWMKQSMSQILSVLHEPCLIVVNDAGKYRFDSIYKSFCSDLIDNSPY